MDSATFSDRVRTSLNAEVVERLLLRYFVEKGHDLNQLIYPASMQDMPVMIPELAGKIEVVPHVINIDFASDSAKLGWNLFVLGNKRCYLGETIHHDLRGLALQLRQGQVMVENMQAQRQQTVKQVIKFVSRVLQTCEGGYVDLTPRTIPNFLLPTMLSGSGINLFSRAGYGLA